MKIYAISWVMASYIDSYIKQIFSCNPCLSIQAFVFPSVKVPSLENIPISTFSTLQVDPDAFYVDFSFDQTLSDEATSWSNINSIKIYSLQEWLFLIAKNSVGSSSILIGSNNIRDFQEVIVSESLLNLIEPYTRYDLKNLLQSFHSLDFRSLHYKDVQTPEGFLRKSIENIAENLDAGIVKVYSYWNDEIFIDLAKIYFSIIEIEELHIFKYDNLIYSVCGRACKSSPSSVIFINSSIFTLEHLSNMQGQIYLIILLDNGLFDLESVLTSLAKIHTKQRLIMFNNISSKISDSFLVCNFYLL
jgi:hypothetical protein